MSWPLISLEEVSIINPKPPKNVDENQEVTFLPMAAVGENSRILTTEFRSFGETKKGFTYFEKGDVILAKITPCFENGKAAYLSKLPTQVGFGSTEFHVIRPKHDEIDAQYIFYMIWSEPFRKVAEKNMTGSAGQKRVPVSFIKKLKIPLPPLPIQKQIAAALEKADTLRQQCQQMEQELNTLAQSVFLEMFGDPVTNPKGWEMIPLGDWAETRAGFAFKSEEYSENLDDVKLCRGINIMPGGFNWKDVVYWKLDKTVGLDKYWMKKGDIVVAMDRPWISSGFKIAQVSEADLPSLLLQRVMRIRGSDLVENNYFYHCLNHQAFLKHSKITETTVPHISPNDINSYRVFKIDRKLLLEFDSRVSVINTMSLNSKKLMIQIETNFNSLMQRAFKGELDFNACA